MFKFAEAQMRFDINRKSCNHRNEERQAGAFLKISRRQLLTRVMIAAAGGLVAMGVASPALAKMSQQTAGYLPTSTTDLKCSGCALFKAPSSCIMVDGTISPDGWCRLFAKKSS
jgi:hypothetical protein